MMAKAFRSLAAVIALALAQVVIVPSAALADVDPGGALDISFVQGDVGVQRGDDPDNQVVAAQNAPLLPGDILTTGYGSYAEIHIGRGVRLRLDGNSQIRVARVDPSGSEVQLGQGDVELRVFEGGSAAQVDTPQVALVGDHVGTFTVALLGDGTSTLASLRGSATVLTQSGQAQTISDGQALAASGTPDAPLLQPVAAQQPSSQFVAFNQTRDAAILRAFANSAVAASPLDGIEDLQAYGQWVNTPYGAAWVPAEPAGWVPYSTGRWAWEPYYGWVWVGSEPWGWTPYHYGRWFWQPGFGWAWVPGPPAPWSPALVAFVRTGGVIAWLALAPRDPFYPWWGPHPAAAFVTNIAVYHNAYVAHAFVTTPIVAFRAGVFTQVRTVPYVSLGHPVFVRSITNVIVPTHANLAFSARALVRPVAQPVPAFRTNAAYGGHPIAVRRAQFAYPGTYQPPAYHPASNGAQPAYGRPASTYQQHPYEYRPPAPHAAAAHPAKPAQGKAKERHGEQSR